MKWLLLLSLSLAVAQEQQLEARHGARYAGTYPDRYHPDGGYYPYPDSGNPYVPPSGCKNWCRRENYYPGHGRQRYYCCDHSGPVIYPRPPYPPYPSPRQKICPASPAVCTRVFSAHAPPTECYSNSECSTVDLCCYDVCLKHKTCKTADYVEGPVRPQPYPYPTRPRPHPRPRPVGIFPGLIGSLFARSSFDEPQSDVADEAVAFRSAKEVKAKDVKKDE